MTTTEEQKERVEPGQAAALRRGLSDAVAPVREQHALIHAAIEAKLAELAELRALEREAAKVLNALEPSRNGKPGPKVKPTRTERAPRASAATTVLVEQFIRETYGEGGEFTVPDMLRESSFDERVGVSRGSLQYAVNALNEQGLIRLDRVGDPGRGPGYAKLRIYRLTAAD